MSSNFTASAAPCGNVGQVSSSAAGVVVQASSLHVPRGLSAGQRTRPESTHLRSRHAFVRHGWFLAAVAFLCAMAMTTSAQPLTGGSYTLVGATATGAGTATGWPYSLSAWVPTEGAGRSAGGAWDLTAGLLGLYGPADDGVWLHVERTTSGSVRLWWSAEITGYQLESTPTLGPTAAWQPVVPTPAGHAYTTDPAFPARFYRLRKP